METTVGDIVRLSCSYCKIYVGNKLVYSPFAGGVAPPLDKRVLWIDAEDGIVSIGIAEGGEEDEEE